MVRFITRRFIGEYDPNLEQVYAHSTIMDNEAVLFEILDAAGHLNVNFVFLLSRPTLIFYVGSAFAFFFLYCFYILHFIIFL